MQIDRLLATFVDNGMLSAPISALFAVTLFVAASVGLSQKVVDDSESARDVCAGRATSVFVQTSAHLLSLCENGKTYASWRVSLGRGGVGKEKQGDAKTPIGRYRLGRPRASTAGFGIFIPVGYPNAEDLKKGKTGSDIGLHGPPEGEPDLLGLARTDWTLGCIAVATPQANQQLAQWIGRRLPMEIVIE